MLEELDEIISIISDLDDKLNDLERINSMVIVTCDAQLC